jgi:hypothetical protein
MSARSLVRKHSRTAAATADGFFSKICALARVILSSGSTDTIKLSQHSCASSYLSAVATTRPVSTYSEIRKRIRADAADEQARHDRIVDRVEVLLLLVVRHLLLSLPCDDDDDDDDGTLLSVGVRCGWNAA